MPTLNKLFTLTVSPEQFLEACSISELHEIELNIQSVINRKVEKLKDKNTEVKEAVLDILKSLSTDLNHVNFH